jgi:hypothetical protein
VQTSSTNPTLLRPRGDGDARSPCGTVLMRDQSEVRMGPEKSGDQCL